ncbi:hypothetical protein [Nocardioides ungokensis]
MYNSHLSEALATARRTEMLAAAEQARLARQAREARASQPRTTPARRRTPADWRTAVRAFRARVLGADLLGNEGPPLEPGQTVRGRLYGDDYIIHVDQPE